MLNERKDCYKDYVLSCGGSEIGNEMPWDCIDLGYRKSFVKREHKKIYKNVLTPCVEKALAITARTMSR